MRFIHAPLVSLLVFSACKGRGGGDDTGPALSTLREIEIPSDWQSSEARVVMRLTNASSTATEVRRALNELFNSPEDPVDAIDFLMRLPERDDGGDLLPVDEGKSDAELLGGSALDQITAYRRKFVEGDGQPFDTAVDACGNPMLMAIASPHVLQEVFSSGVEELEAWPESCPDGANCETARTGSWDVALGEMRFDGMIDMVVNVNPDLNVDPAGPGLLGHFTGFFLSTNNPGLPMASLFAGARRVQVNLTGIWQLDRAYTDPLGTREVFMFPHRARTMNTADIFVFMEGYEGFEKVWESEGYAQDYELPFGTEQESAVLIDVTSAAGLSMAQNAGADAPILGQLTDVFTYQIGAALACPSVREPAWIRQGPVEFFLCPEGDVQECVAREDLEEIACALPEETVFDPFQPTQPVVTFPRLAITSPTDIQVLPEAQVPHYLQTPVAGVQVEVELEVTADSVLQTRGLTRLVSARSATGLPTELPVPVANSHCPTDPVQRYNLGETWDPGTYFVTVDLSEDPDGTPGSGDELVLDDATGEFLLWLYYSSVPTWVAN